MAPRYDPEDVKPMIEELTNVGFEALTTAGEVDDLVCNTPGTALLVVNSVCGCAAGSCRPGVALALQHKTIPDRLATVFAGVDMEAVERARELMPGIVPSSPCIALFEDGKMIDILERRHIEQATLEEVGKVLKEAFDKYCSAEGPSVPLEVFEQNKTDERCGSSIPLFEGE